MLKKKINKKAAVLTLGVLIAGVPILSTLISTANKDSIAKSSANNNVSMIATQESTDYAGSHSRLGPVSPVIKTPYINNPPGLRDNCSEQSIKEWIMLNKDSVFDTRDKNHWQNWWVQIDGGTFEWHRDKFYVVLHNCQLAPGPGDMYNARSNPFTLYFFNIDTHHISTKEKLNKVAVSQWFFSDYKKTTSVEEIVDNKFVWRRNLEAALVGDPNCWLYFFDQRGRSPKDNVPLNELVYPDVQAFPTINGVNLGIDSNLLQDWFIDGPALKIVDFWQKVDTPTTLVIKVKWNACWWYENGVMMGQKGVTNNINAPEWEIELNGFIEKGKTTIVYKPVSVFGTSLATQYVTDITLDDVKAFMRSQINYSKVIGNLPSDFGPDNINVTSISTPDKKAGTLDFSFTLNNYYDDAGIKQTGTSKPFSSQLNGFKPLLPSNCLATVPVTDDQIHFLYVSEVTDQQITDFVTFNMNTIFRNLPTGAAISGAINITERNYAKGTITITCKTDKWFNTSLDLIDNVSEIPLQQIILTDFTHKNTTDSQTTVVSDYTVRKPLNEYYVDEVNLTDVKEQIEKNYSSFITNTPVGFNFDTDVVLGEFPTITYEDKTSGSISLPVTLKKYVNDAGLYIAGDKTVTIKVNGFVKKAPTVIPPTFSVAGSKFANNYVSAVNIENTKQFIIDHADQIFENLPKDADVSKDLTIDEIVSRDYNKGIVNIKLTLAKTLNDKLVEEAKTATMALTGFRNLDGSEAGATATIPDYVIYQPGLSDKFICDIDNTTLIDYLKDNYKSYLKFYPYDLTSADVSVTIDDSVKNDKNNRLLGELPVKIGLTKYIDETGMYIETSTPKEFNLVVHGFKKVEPTILKVPFISVNDTLLRLKYANQVTTQDAMDVFGSLYPKLFNCLPDPFNPSTDIEVTNLSDLNYNDGSIKVTFNVKKWWSTDATVIEKNDQSIIFTGLRTPYDKGRTQISPEVPINGEFIDKYVNEIDKASLESWINDNKSKFAINLPEGISPNDITVEVSANYLDNPQNLLDGKIPTTVTVNKWIDAGGMYNDTPPMTGRCDITGFRKVIPSSFNDRVSVNTSNLIRSYVSEVSDDDIINFVRNNITNIFENLPKSFDPNADVTLVEAFDKNYNDGTMKVKLNVSKWFDKTAQLVEKNNIVVTLFDFKNPKTEGQPTGKTTVHPSINVTDPLAAEYLIDADNAQIIEWMYDNYKSYIDFIPAGFDPRQDMELSVGSDKTITANKMDGQVSVNINLKKWIDTNGQFIENRVQPYVIMLKGFTPMAPSKFLKEGSPFDITGPGIADNALRAKNPYEVTAQDIKQLIINNKNSLFENLNKEPNYLQNNLSVEIQNSQSSAGTLTAELTFTKWINADCNYETKVISQQFSAFKTFDYTTKLQSAVVSDKYGDIMFLEPSQIKKDPMANKDFIDFLKDNVLVNKGDDIQITAIDIGTTDDEVGRMQINSITTINSWNKDHNIMKDPVQITGIDIFITGFKHPPTTIRNKGMFNGRDDIMASQVSANDIREGIIANPNDVFINLPKDINSINLQVTITNCDKFMGKIFADITMDKTLDESGNIVNKPALFKMVISGFKLSKQTYLKSSSVALPKELSDTYASTIVKNLGSGNAIDNSVKTYIINNMIVNKPDSLTIAQIIIKSNDVEYDDEAGIIMISKVTLTNWTNDQGTIQTSPQDITTADGSTADIQGFLHNVPFLESDIMKWVIYVTSGATIVLIPVVIYAIVRRIKSYKNRWKDKLEAEM